MLRIYQSSIETDSELAVEDREGFEGKLDKERGDRMDMDWRRSPPCGKKHIPVPATFFKLVAKLKPTPGIGKAGIKSTGKVRGNHEGNHEGSQLQWLNGLPNTIFWLQPPVNHSSPGPNPI